MGGWVAWSTFGGGGGSMLLGRLPTVRSVCHIGTVLELYVGCFMPPWLGNLLPWLLGVHIFGPKSLGCRLAGLVVAWPTMGIVYLD